MVQDYVTAGPHQGLRRASASCCRRRCATPPCPTLTLTGVQFTFLIGGTVIIERIFSYPGIGNLAIDAVINRDLPLIQGLVLTFGGDLHRRQPDRRLPMTVWLNPRLRHA